MRYRLVLNIFFILLFFYTLCMVLPLFVAAGDHDGMFFRWLFLVLGLSVVSLAGWMSTRDARDLTHREGFFIVTLTWVGFSFFGGIPYMLSGSLPALTDAFFETMSGLTTTGATVLTVVEDVPRSVLLWRSMTQWLGGMGVVVLSIALLPLLGVGAMQLFRAEVPGPQIDRITPRITQTAKVLWGVYMLFTALEIVLLRFGGMSWFDGVCHAFTTMSTGGFSTRTASVAYYDSAYIETVIIVFMFLAGVNFSLHFAAMRGRLGTLFKDGEFKSYCAIFIVAIVMVALNIRGLYGSVGAAIRAATFQVVSIGTTTGYCTENFELWPTFSKYLLILLMFIGGCAGSTAGGIKVVRVCALWKQALIEVRRSVLTKLVAPIRIGTLTIMPNIVSAIQGFFLLFALIFTTSTIAMSLMGLDIVTSFASVVACLSNIGPGLAKVGAIENYSHIPMLGKWLLSVCMLLGRLEIYTVLVVFLPNLWSE